MAFIEWKTVEGQKNRAFYFIIKTIVIFSSILIHYEMKLVLDGRTLKEKTNVDKYFMLAHGARDKSLSYINFWLSAPASRTKHITFKLWWRLADDQIHHILGVYNYSITCSIKTSPYSIMGQLELCTIQN